MTRYRQTYGQSDDWTTLVFRGRVPPNTAITGAATVNWTEDTDTHNVYGGGTGIVTIPAGLGGIYSISVSWKPAGATAVSALFYVNGTQIATSHSNTAAAFSGGATTIILPLAAADQLTIRFSATHTTTNDTTYNTWCHVVRLRS